MARTGRPAVETEILAARGSWRAKARQKAAAQAAKPRAKGKAVAWRAPSKAEMIALTKLIPGYDPEATKGDSYFKHEAAVDAIKFIETMLRHMEGAMIGQLFRLEPWQRAVVANLFGWKRKNPAGKEVRRYREALIYVPRKNGKTPMVAAICMYVLFNDGEAGAQVYGAAAERKQAALLFRQARGMVVQSPELTEKSKIYGGLGQLSIVLNADEASSYQVISADAYSKHGFNLHFAAVDELHAQKNRDLIDTLTTSMASANRLQPLMIYLTTADFARESICNEKYEYAKKVRDQIVPEPSFLPVIYEADKTADWRSPDVWADANPNLGVSVDREYLERECKKAQETPTYENTFRRLHLNQQTETDVRWLPMDKWDAVKADNPVEWRRRAMDELAGLPCWGGLDLSATQDITAFVLAFPVDESMVLLPWFWVPTDSAEKRERRDRVPYITWERQGWLHLTRGIYTGVIDYAAVREEIGRLGGKFQIRGIGYDPWNASQIVNDLTGDGFEMTAMRQGFPTLSAPSKELERLLVAGCLDHGGNPVLRWMASNCSAVTDSNANIMPSKGKSTERIDGIVASVMAIGLAMQNSNQEQSWGILA
jgi:phage terminase large subunit-like protein